MNETTAPISLRARLIFPISSPPIDGGVVTIQGDRIVAVGRNASTASVCDLGDVALLPGLVNAHTHLEFSELRSPLGKPGMPLADWIGAVVTRRRAERDLEGAALSRGRRAEAIEAGFRQCLQGGTTTVGDIATWDVTDRLPPTGALRYLEFRELIGLSAKRIAEQLEAVHGYLAASRKPSARIKRGLSPHAPYTAASSLVQQVADLSKQRQLNVAMHLAESSEELRLISRGEGPFRDLLERFDVWDEGAFPGGMRALDYLRMLAVAHRSLIIHGNFLGPEDWALLARQRETMSVVHCPRTHDYFRHPPYPLSRMLSAGVRVALGTDSRASNPDLNLFKEWQFAAERHADVDPHRLLRMVTLDAAESLGWAGQIGSLENGKRADLAVVQLGKSAADDRDPCAALLGDDSRIRGVWIGGMEMKDEG